MPETSTAVPAPARDDALVPAAEEIDEETVLAAITALRKYEIGVAVGATAPILMGLLMLVAPPGLVPGAALVAVMATCIGAVPLAVVQMRRAFLAECASLGIARPTAKRLLARVLRAELRLQKGSQQARDRALAATTSTALEASR